jgi:signal peptidase I
MDSSIAFYIFAFPLLILATAGYWKLFEKAGRHGWEALIPVYSIYVMLKISGRPVWWLIWLIIPGINVIICVGIYLDFIKSYGKFTIRQQSAGILLSFIYLPKWGFEQKTVYLGQSATVDFREKYRKNLNKSSVREWTEAIIFATVAATLIRTFFIEAYVIPTPSMERSMLVGDFLCVSKFNYGARVPMTPIAFPFAHHTLPMFNVKAYWDGFELPYYRLPGLSNVKKGDVVVFNYPMDADSPYYRPVDKQENYIKRCQGTPGDTLSLLNAQVYVNGKMALNPPGEQIDYTYTTAGVDLNPKVLDELHISIYEGNPNPTMTDEAAGILKGYANVKSLFPRIAKRGYAEPLDPVFPAKYPIHVMLNPKLPDYKWNVDNFGPIIIPKKGWTVKLDSMTFPLYERAIEVYEKNKVQVAGKDILINGKKTNSYTFKMNYYWMMGDNRHDSEDSRYWGFVPEDHIEGKALLIWMSMDDNASFFNRIRWSRIFRAIH